MLKPYIDDHGYPMVTVAGRKERVHVLMLEAFVGPRPAGQLGCHKNDVPGDNRLGNLYWGTKSHNGIDCVNNGTNHNRNKTHCPQGHEYTPTNTYVMRSGGRMCRLCHAARNRKARNAKKQKALRR